MGGQVKKTVDTELIPNYYRDFACIGGDCKDSCCEFDWRIDFSKDDYLKIKRADLTDELKGLTESQIKRVHTNDARNKRYGIDLKAKDNHRCPFKNDEGLCKLQLKCGHEVLPHVCRSYPRKENLSVTSVVRSVSPSCEAVLQLLWDMPEGVKFERLPIDGEHLEACFDPETTFNLFADQMQDVYIAILQNRSMTLTDRLLYLGLVLQRLINGGVKGIDPDKWAERTLAEMDAIGPISKDIPGNPTMFLMQNFNILHTIAKTHPNRVRELAAAAKISGDKYTFTGKNYGDALVKFKKAFSDREYFFENLIIAAAVQMGFPYLGDAETLWGGYVSLCNLFSYYMFVSVLSCADEPSKENLFHVIVMASRSLLHNHVQFDGFRSDLVKNESSSLAHMAILLQWD